MISHPGMHSHIDPSPHSWSAGPTVESDIYSSGGNPNSFLGQPPPLFRASLAGKRDDPVRIDNPVPGDIKARRERVERVPNESRVAGNFRQSSNSSVGRYPPRGDPGDLPPDTMIESCIHARTRFGR